MKRREAKVLLVLAGALWLSGCGEEPVRTYRVPKEEKVSQENAQASKKLPPDHPPIDTKSGLPPDHPPIGQPGLPPDHPPIGGGSGTQASSQSEVKALAWDAPANWVQKPAGGMRAASFEVPGPGDAKGDLSVIVLGGGAGGVLPNVNRWRGQIGAEPWSQEALDREVQKISAPAGTILFVDLRKQPPEKRILAGMLERGGQTWFFKLIGEDEALEGSKAAFMDFLKTVRSTGQ